MALAICALAFVSTMPAVRAEEAAPAPAASYATSVSAPGGAPQPVSTSVDAEEARHLPGTGGDPSVAAQDLPGVARPAPGATGLVVWGTTPNETRVLFDGIEIPALYHFGGFRSTVGAELVGQIDLVPGAYSAEYGRALGGILRIDPLPLSTTGTHLLLDANLLDTSVSFRTSPFRRLHVAVAARTSYLDQTYGRVAPAPATALFPIPHYSDAQVEAVLDVAPHATLRAFLLTSLDRVREDLGSPAMGLSDRVEDQRLTWWRAAVSYEEHGDDDRLAVTLFVGGDHSSLAQQFGPVPAAEDVASTELGLRARYRARLAPGVRLALGVDSLLERSRFQRAGSLTVPAREGDVTVFGQPPGDDVNADNWSATVGDIGPFAVASFMRGPWTFTPGLRADAFPVDGSRALPPVGTTPVIGYAHLAWALDPRISVAYSISQRLILTAAAGLYHQPVDPADLSAVFGSPALGPERAAHAALSAWARLTEATTVEVTGYYRRLDNLAVRSTLVTPVLGEALVADGHGQAFGVDLLVRRELARGTFGWLAYSLSRSERWTDGGPVRLLDFDQTNVLTAVASHQRRAWTFSGRARFATGMPRTPVVGSFVDLRDGVYQPVFGPQNSVRLPPFFQLDARVDRRLVAGPVNVTLYLDVQNLTGRRNPEEVVYTQNYQEFGYLTGPPLLVLFGVRIES